jgi:hypothetical protein
MMVKVQNQPELQSLLLNVTRRSHTEMGRGERRGGREQRGDSEVGRGMMRVFVSIPL